MLGSVEATRQVKAEVVNTVDVNLSKINGYRNSFYDHNLNKVYDRIPVYTGN